MAFTMRVQNTFFLCAYLSHPWGVPSKMSPYKCIVYSIQPLLFSDRNSLCTQAVWVFVWCAVASASGCHHRLHCHPPYQGCLSGKEVHLPGECLVVFFFHLLLPTMNRLNLSIMSSPSVSVPGHGDGSVWSCRLLVPHSGPILVSILWSVDILHYS